MDKIKQLEHENSALRSLGLSYALCDLLLYDENMDCDDTLKDIEMLAGKDIFAPFYFLAQFCGDSLDSSAYQNAEAIVSSLESCQLTGKPFFHERSIYLVIQGVEPESVRDSLSRLAETVHQRFPGLQLFVSSVATNPKEMKRLHHEIAVTRDFGAISNSVVYSSERKFRESVGLIIQELELELYRLVEQNKYFEASTAFDRLLDILAEEYVMSMSQLREETHFRVIQLRRIAQSEHLDSSFRDVLYRIDTASDMNGLKAAVYDTLNILELSQHHYPDDNSKKVFAIIQYIESNYDRSDLTAASLCEKFMISPSHLSRTFKQNTGTGVLEYINLQRIEAAKSLLSNTELSIDQIARKTGFVHRGTFINAFKRIEHITPGKYRSRSKL